jgi:hypothetical protein
VRQNPLLALGGPRSFVWWAGVGYANARHLSLLAWLWQALCHDWSGALLPGVLAASPSNGADVARQWAARAAATLLCLGLLLRRLLLASPPRGRLCSNSFKRSDAIDALADAATANADARAEAEALRAAAAWGAA